MAVRGCTRRISSLLQVHTKCGKQIHSKTQPTLTGIQTQVAWNERLGCGTSKEGRVVVVTDRTW